jgi:ATP-binding cassette subfamily C protein
MLRLFRIFFKAQNTRPFFVLFCLLLASLSEAMSISALLPAIAAVSGGGGSGSGFEAAINSAITSLGLSPTLPTMILILVGFMVLKSALAFAALSYAGVAASRVAISFRRRLIAAIFDARWSFFADQKSGRFANVIASDAGRAGDAYLYSAQVIAFGIQAIAYILVALAINWKLALMGVGASVFIAIVMRQLIRSAKRAGYKQTSRTEALTVYMMDMLTNIKPLKTMQRHEAMLGSVTGMLKKLKRALVNRELSKAGLAQGSDALMAIIVGVVLYFASTYAKVTLPELVVSGVIFFQIISIVSKLQRLLQQSVQVESAYLRTDELIRNAEANRETLDGRIQPPAGKPCSFEAVSFSHGDKVVISNVTFDIPASAITVLSGPSGSGKTTLIDLLIGLHRPSAGRILIGGIPLEEIDLKAWRRMIGYVPQELSLFHTTIRDNITLGDENISDAAVMAALTRAGASDFISALPQGLATDVGEMGSKFSGGQRQRISLARALVTDPKTLILDEVTSALDPQTEAGIVENISALRGEYTIIAITHRPAWTRVADRLYKVSHGKVTAAEPPGGVVKQKPGSVNVQ